MTNEMKHPLGEARKQSVSSRAAALEQKLWENHARGERERLGKDLTRLLSTESLEWTGFSETRELGGAIIPTSGRFQTRFGLQGESRTTIQNLLECMSNEEMAEFVYVGLGNSRQKTGLFACILAIAVNHLFDLLELDGDTVTLIHAGHRWAVSVDLVLDERTQDGYSSFYEVQVLGDLADRAEKCASCMSLDHSG